MIQNRKEGKEGRYLQEAKPQNDRSRDLDSFIHTKIPQNTDGQHHTGQVGSDIDGELGIKEDAQIGTRVDTLRAWAWVPII